MLFMDIVTWEPEKRNEVIKRASEWKPPEEMKIIGEWVDLTGNRAFVLYEESDPEVILAANFGWSDICKIKQVPVMEMKDAMTLLQKCVS